MLNNDFKELVKKYRKYESRKKSKNLLLLSLSAILLLIITWIFFTNSKTDITSANMNNTLPTKTTRVIVEKSQPIHKEERITQKKRKLTKEELKNEIKEEIKKELLDHKKEKKESNTNRFRFQVTTKKSSKQQLLEFHRKKNSYSSAIALANYFYSKKLYKDAIKWAIVASKKNKFKEQPWLIYAKSKIALGEKDKAKKALNLYLKSNESKSAQNLLDSL